MKHLVLLGDSIFDNQSYVPGEEPVVEQVREELEDPWRVTLLAVDGDVTTDVVGRLDRLPEDATHLMVSVGGNDALRRSDILERHSGNPTEVFGELAHIQEVFRTNYRDMLEEVVARQLPTVVCTIYDHMPFSDHQMRRMVMVALSVFNDCIVREAGRQGVPVLDLRELCLEPTDYSELSPIEPSCEGGVKIAYAIARLLRDHDFAHPRTTVYS